MLSQSTNLSLWDLFDGAVDLSCCEMLCSIQGSFKVQSAQVLSLSPLEAREGGRLEENSLKRNRALNKQFGWDCYAATCSCGKRWPHKVNCIYQTFPDLKKEEKCLILCIFFLLSTKPISKLSKWIHSSVASFRDRRDCIGQGTHR